jgi:Phage integrase, N-terminal SAM-like domain
MMNDWYQPMIDTLQLNGKGERTQQAYTRAVRMLSEFYYKTPDLVSEQELTTSSTAKTSITGPPRPCAFVIAESGFSTRRSSTAIGTSLESLEPKPNTVFPRSCKRR